MTATVLADSTIFPIPDDYLRKTDADLWAMAREVADLAGDQFRRLVPTEHGFVVAADGEYGACYDLAGIYPVSPAERQYVATWACFALRDRRRAEFEGEGFRLCRFGCGTWMRGGDH